MLNCSRYAVSHSRGCAKGLLSPCNYMSFSVFRTHRGAVQADAPHLVFSRSRSMLSILSGRACAVLPPQCGVILPMRPSLLSQRMMGGGPRTTKKGRNGKRKGDQSENGSKPNISSASPKKIPKCVSSKATGGKTTTSIARRENLNEKKVSTKKNTENRRSPKGGKQSGPAKSQIESPDRGMPKVFRQLDSYVYNLKMHAGTVEVIQSPGSRVAEVVATLQLPNLHGLPNPLQIREVGHIVNACETVLKKCRNRKDVIAKESDFVGIASDVRAKRVIPNSTMLLSSWKEANRANLSSELHVNAVTKGLVHVEFGMTFNDIPAGQWIAERLGSMTPKWYCLHNDGDQGRNRISEIVLMDLQEKAGLDLNNIGALPGTKIDLTQPTLQYASMFLDMIASSKMEETSDLVSGQSSRRQRQVWTASVTLPLRLAGPEKPTLIFEGDGKSRDNAVDNALVVGAQSAYAQLNTGTGEDMALRDVFSHAAERERRVLGLQVPFVPRPLKSDIQHLLGAGSTDGGVGAGAESSQWLSAGDPRTEVHAHPGAAGRQERGRGQLSPLRHELLNVQLRAEVEALGDGQPALTAIRDALPITALRDDLHRQLQDHRVIVVSGGTGSGKTTQIPQYILDDAIRNNNGTLTNIVVTQPRRIAAVSVAARVAHERGEQVGHTVGYRVRHQSKPARDYASIEFCTTGVLLRSLQDDPLLANASHVIVDEVHERDVSTDFLLMKLKDLLHEHPNRDLKVILMSATLDAEAFSTYFGGAPLIEVPSATRFPVEEIYLEDLEGRFQGDRYAREVIGSALHYETELLRGQRERLEAYAQQEQEKLMEVKASGKTANKDIKTPDPNRGAFPAPTAATPTDTAASDDAGVTPRKTMEEKLAWAEHEHAALLADVGVTTPTPAGQRDGRGGHARKKKGDQGATYKVASWLLQQLVKENMSKISHSPRRDTGGVPNTALEQTDGAADTTFTAPHSSGASAPPPAMGSVLCFLPGWDNIKEIRRLLEDSPLNKHMKVIALHSTVPHSEQQAAFEPAPPGVTKIILATNIAESSVTIDDAVAVVDCGRVKELNYNPHRRMSTLDTSLASQASATQRRGRAGRVGPGQCYRLFSRPVYAAMADRAMPEILRMELQQTCLLTKALMPAMPVQASLQKAMNPPLAEHIDLALNRLQNLGAIGSSHDNTDDVQQTSSDNTDVVVAPLPSTPESTYGTASEADMDGLTPIERLKRRILQRGSGVDGDNGDAPLHAPSLVQCGERLTYLGQRLVALPLDPMVGKMLMLGATFGCTTPIATVAACYSAQSPFVPAAALREQATRSKIKFNETSDVFAAVTAYGEWQRQRQEYGYRAAADWAYEHNLVQSSLQGIENVEKQLVHELSRIGYFSMRDFHHEEPNDVAGPNRRADDEALVKALSTAGVAANLACKSSLPGHTVLQTTVDARVNIHPGSLNNPMWRHHKRGRTSPFWYTYSTKIMNANQVTLRDTTACQPLDVLLFGGFELHPEESNITGICGRLDDYIVCCGYNDDFQHLRLLRRALDDIFLRRVRSPRMHAQSDMFERDEQVLSVIADVVNGNHNRGAHRQSTSAGMDRLGRSGGRDAEWSDQPRPLRSARSHGRPQDATTWSDSTNTDTASWSDRSQWHSRATRTRRQDVRSTDSAEEAWPEFLGEDYDNSR